ncbi:MAG: hypothetical protein ACLTSZ_06425 [Lachnospiraceae bacterium]
MCEYRTATAVLPGKENGNELLGPAWGCGGRVLFVVPCRIDYG